MAVKTTYSGNIIACTFMIFAMIHHIIEAKLRFSEARIKDWCPDVPQCECYEDKTKNDINYTSVNKLSASCVMNDTQLLDKLPIQNITNLQFTKVSTAIAAEVMKKLRDKTTNLKKLTLMNGQLDYFDIQWLPDNIEEFSIKSIKIKKFIPNNGNSNSCIKEKKRLKNVKIVKQVEMESIIPCIPESVSKIFLRDTNISSDVSLPRSLAHLKITSFRIGNLLQNLLNSTNNLKTLLISSMTFQDGIIPHIGSKNTLKSLLLQSCNLTILQPDYFLSFTNLSTINLINNDIKEMHAQVPKSLKSLLLSFNAIETITKNQWIKSSLTDLNLKYNQMTSVPLGLPETIEKIYLSHNQIEICLPEVFQHLTNLKILDLSYNNLKTMPVGLHLGLIEYNLVHNSISLVPGPSAYNFCKKCTSFGFGNNKWLCDKEFFRMMLWMVTDTKPELVKNFYRRLQVASNGECTNIPKDALTIEYLNHTRTFLQQIQSAPFNNCRYESQEALICTDANLEMFPNSPPNGLKTVIIDGNWKLNKTPDNLFLAQTTLKTLQVNRNSLKRIPYGLPSSIKFLIMQENNITELTSRDVQAFKFLHNLKELFLEGNKLKTIYSTQFKSLTNLRWIGLEENELICDCSLHSLIVWYRNLAPIRSHYNLLMRYARCKYPIKWYDRDIRKLYGIYEYQLQCVPATCKWKEGGMEAKLNCSLAAQMERKWYHFSTTEPITEVQPNIPRNTFWRSLDISGLKLNENDINLKHLELTQVDLSENQLTKWPLKNLPNTIEELALQKNYISYLPNRSEITQYLPHLRFVDLRYNKIKMLSVEKVQLLLFIGSVLMEGNPFICNCTQDHFITWVRANGSSSSSSEKFDLQDLYCASPKGMRNKRIQSISSKDICHDGITEILIVGICLLVIIALSIPIAILALYMKRKREYKIQILNGFQKLLQQETSLFMKGEILGTDNKSFKYDCFVASEDTKQDNQYLKKLIHELEEKRNLTLCIAHRDFPPGIDVADTIVGSIKNSKCIILMLSRSFISSPWCQYEVQVALTELHQRQRKLLVPILIENWEVEDDIPGAVKSFMNLIPPIDAPKLEASAREWGKFWKTIEKLLDTQ